MIERLLIAGSGGQGVILIGRLLASVAVNNVPHITFLPAYGAEVRGGVSNCQVILSSKKIASPVSEQFDSIILMNQESADKFLSRASANCLIVINSSLCKIPKNITSVAVNATELADRLGNTRVANFVMLGAYLARKNFVPPDAIEKELIKILSAKNRNVVDINLKAFRAGLNP